jgi:hypothetical protein
MPGWCTHSRWLVHTLGSITEVFGTWRSSLILVRTSVGLVGRAGRPGRVRVRKVQPTPARLRALPAAPRGRTLPIRSAAPPAGLPACVRARGSAHVSTLWDLAVRLADVH